MKHVLIRVPWLLLNKVNKVIGHTKNSIGDLCIHTPPPEFSSWAMGKWFFSEKYKMTYILYTDSFCNCAWMSVRGNHFSQQGKQLILWGGGVFERNNNLGVTFDWKLFLVSVGTHKYIVQRFHAIYMYAHYKQGNILLWFKVQRNNFILNFS